MRKNGLDIAEELVYTYNSVSKHATVYEQFEREDHIEQGIRNDP